MSKNNFKNSFSLTAGLARAGQIGFNIAMPILIAVLAGRYLDDRFFPGKYFLTLTLSLGGGFFSMWYVCKTALSELNKEILTADKKEEKESK